MIMIVKVLFLQNLPFFQCIKNHVLFCFFHVFPFGTSEPQVCVYVCVLVVVHMSVILCDFYLFFASRSSDLRGCVCCWV